MERRGMIGPGCDGLDMPMLSTLLRFRLFDDNGRRHDLDDIAVALLESD